MFLCLDLVDGSLIEIGGGRINFHSLCRPQIRPTKLAGGRARDRLSLPNAQIEMATHMIDTTLYLVKQFFLSTKLMAATGWPTGAEIVLANSATTTRNRNRARKLMATDDDAEAPLEAVVI